MNMKRLFALLLSFLLCFALLSGCGNKTDEQNDQTENSTEVTDCVEHLDTNSDFCCDHCGVALELECANHVDSIYDGYCDICDEHLGFVCTEHTDLDGDGACDICGEFF